MSAARSRFTTAVAVALCTTAGSLGLAACGSDSESTTAPQSSGITRETSTQSTTESTTTASTTTTKGNGGVGPGGGQGGNVSSGGDSGGSSVPDTPSHDVVPPANTPQGKFEQYCNQNPGACG